MQNKVILIGRLGQKNLSATSNQKSVMQFSMATTESYKDKVSNDWKELTEWHQLAAFDNCAEHINTRVNPGDLLYVEGKLRTKKWQDENGKDHYTTSIIVKDFPKKLPRYFTKNGNDTSAQPNIAPSSQTQPKQMPSSNFSQDDDIPF